MTTFRPPQTDPVPTGHPRDGPGEIRKAEGFTGVLPWAVPEVDPNAVVAVFYDESNGNVVGAQTLIKGQILNLNNTQTQQWAGDVSADVKAKTGVVIMTSQQPNPTITGPTAATLNSICSQPGATCYAGKTYDDNSGLALVRAITNGAAASASNPKLSAISFGAGSCTKDTSAGYFVLEGDCNPNVTAQINFGVANPVIAPTYARVTLIGPGCPCTMAWRQSDNTWVLNSGSPRLTSGDGQHEYSMTWQTGGSGPGAVQVALISPAGPSQSDRVLAGPSPSGTLIVTKNVANGSAVPSDWTITVRDSTNAVVDSFPASSSHTTSVFAGDSYTVTESGGPSGYVLTYGAGCNSSGQVTIPNGSPRQPHARSRIPASPPRKPEL